jgi:hypothetical protein
MTFVENAGIVFYVSFLLTQRRCKRTVKLRGRSPPLGAVFGRTGTIAAMKKPFAQKQHLSTAARSARAGWLRALRPLGRHDFLILITASVTLLALTRRLQLWQVAAAAAMLGIASAFFFPAYSAILPRILPPEELLAANGMEGTIRPVLQQAAGPAVAGMIIAATSPAHTAALIAAAHTIAFTILLRLRSDDGGEPSVTARSSVWADLREGVAYTVRTPWLLWTLLYAIVLLLLLMGPLEVLLPFAIRQQLGGGAQTFGFMLAMFGIGGAAGALIVSSFRLPRRYLTLMMLLWGFGTVPMGILGLTNSFWLMAAALATCGFTWGVAQVIWGTLLQRRVPPHLLGRVSSLDFFVSLALMPVSMALAGRRIGADLADLRGGCRGVTRARHRCNSYCPDAAG